jgi:hypothetical protein
MRLKFVIKCHYNRWDLCKNWVATWNAVFWDVAPYRSCVNRRFGGTYRLHHQGRKIRERGTSVSRWLQAYPEDGGIFLTSALVGGQWPASRPCRFTPGERAPGTHFIGGWVDPRAGLDDMEK